MNILRAANLESPDIAHGFFGRKGGVSQGIFASLNCGPGSGDARADVIENRRRVPDSLDANARLLTLYQIHSPNVVTVTAPWNIGEGPQADAVVTSAPGIALGILTADCAPVLFADAEAKIVGAAHAGWKGALGGVTDATVAAMEALPESDHASARPNTKSGRNSATDSRTPTRATFDSSCRATARIISASIWKAALRNGLRLRESPASNNSRPAPMLTKATSSATVAPPIAVKQPQ